MSAGGGSGATCLDLNEIPEGQTEVQFVIGAAALGLDDEYYVFAEEVRVDFVVTRVEETFGLKGTVETFVQGECCRCLSPTRTPIRGQVALLIQRSTVPKDQRQFAADEEDLELLPPETRNFELREVVRECLVLELPVRVYCRPDCKGLCPHCGRNLNEGPCACTQETHDPRWNALEKVEFT